MTGSPGSPSLTVKKAGEADDEEPVNFSLMSKRKYWAELYITGKSEGIEQSCKINIRVYFEPFSWNKWCSIFKTRHMVT